MEDRRPWGASGKPNLAGSVKDYEGTTRHTWGRRWHGRREQSIGCGSVTVYEPRCQDQHDLIKKSLFYR